jgi:hypothetical protein
MRHQKLYKIVLQNLLQNNRDIFTSLFISVLLCVYLIGYTPVHNGNEPRTSIR